MLIIRIGLSPFPVITTRINTFLVGNPDKILHMPLLLGRGPRPVYIYIYMNQKIYIANSWLVINVMLMVGGLPSWANPPSNNPFHK